jgi:hypothetical protein
MFSPNRFGDQLIRVNGTLVPALVTPRMLSALLLSPSIHRAASYALAAHLISLLRLVPCLVSAIAYFLDACSRTCAGSCMMGEDTSAFPPYPTPLNLSSHPSRSSPSHPFPTGCRPAQAGATKPPTSPPAAAAMQSRSSCGRSL